MPNPFDQFDETAQNENPFDQFDSDSLASRYYSGGLTEDQASAAEELERRGKVTLRAPEWGMEHPNIYGLYGAGKAILEQAVRPAVETVGMIGGGIAGVPVGQPALGGALGYGFTTKAMDIVEDLYKKIGEEPLPVRTIKGEFLDSAYDVGMAYAMGKGLEIGESVLWAADKYLFEKLPERLYASATKMPLSKKWTQVLPGKQLTKRQVAVKEGLSTKTPPSEFGAAKAEALENEVKNYIDDVISILDDNPENIINTNEMLQRGLKRAYAKAERSSDPIGAKATVDDIAEKFRAHGETLKPSQANEIKRQLYDEVKWGGTEATAVQSQVISRAKKGIAHELMKSLEKIYPELKTLNQKDAARIFLKDAIERAAGREMNTNMVKLGPKILLRPKTWPLALFDSTIGHPQVKARIAFALSKANPSKYSQFVYPEMPRGYVPSAKEISKGVYRYAPKQSFEKAVLPPKLKTQKWPAEPKSTIKNKMEVAKENFDRERLRYLEQRFEDLERAKSKIGSPLMKPSESFSKSPKPKTVEERLMELEK